MSSEALRAFAPRRLLIVDDDPMTCEILGEHYSALGFTVEQADNGASALAAVERQRPDIILCDRVMPNGSGAELLAEIRARSSEWQAIAFLFVTGLSSHRDRFAMLDLKPDGYITKPIDFHVADTLLADILRSRKS
jgi:DNA-binding response OmpR family regulator